MDAVRKPRVFQLCLGVALLLLPACRLTSWPLWQTPSPPSGSYEVQRVANVAYYEGPQADSVRHRLDMFMPKGMKDFPVVVLVHGGAWTMGDNRCCGLYSSVGQYLASQGIGAVLPNYRLTPGVKHPEHIKDLARAFAWTRNNIRDYGGRTDEIFLMGHS